jgi:shikimate kinase
VIATGGGTPGFHHNIDYMNGQGITIFLNVPLEIVAKRLTDQGTEARPLLRNKTTSELLGQLHDHFLQRKAYYLKALIHLEGGAISLEIILDELESL